MSVAVHWPPRVTRNYYLGEDRLSQGSRALSGGCKPYLLRGLNVRFASWMEGVSRVFYQWVFKDAQMRLAEIVISCKCLLPNQKAHVAELVDALDSGSSGGNPVDVRVIS